MYAFLFLPVLLHSGALALDFHKKDPFPFQTLDFFLLIAVLLYVCVGLFAMRKRQRGLKFLLLCYSAAIPIIAFEVIAPIAGIGPAKALPWTPMRRISTAAGTMPGIEGRIEFTINKMGLRAPGVWPDDRNDRILCVGGSTTECLYVTDEESWPWLTGTMLSEELGRPVLVASTAKSGQFTPHHEYQLAHYKHAKKFGRVIVLCGMNDAGTFLRNDYKERAYGVPSGSLTTLPASQGAYYRQSTILAMINEMRRLAQVTEAHEVQWPDGGWYNGTRWLRRRLLRSNTIREIPDGIDEALELYRQNLVKIVETCAKNDQQLLFLTQPTMYHKDMPRGLQRLLWERTNSGAYSHETLATVVDSYNEMMKKVSRDHGVDCIDLASILPKDTTVLYDDCHFNTSGCAKVGEILTQHFAEKMRDK